MIQNFLYWYKDFTVSDNLDLKDLMSAELFLRNMDLTIVSRIIVWILHEHSETGTFHLCN